MKQETEIEFKQILTLDEFNNIKEDLKLSNNDFKIQTNYYLDTKDLELSKQKMALRVRETENDFTLTLKVKTSDHVTKEYHQKISYEQFINFDFNIADIISKIPTSYEALENICTLKTFRAQVNFSKYTLFLDDNEYLDQKDYELEMEVDSLDDYIYFEELLKKYNIKKTKSSTKIARALNHYVNSR